MNRIFKFPNGVTLDLSNIEDEPCKVFIKDNYISRIADKLEKQKIKNLIKLHIQNNYLLPKDLKIIMPKDVPISKERLIKEAYKEFLSEAGMTETELDNYLKLRAIKLAAHYKLF